MPEVKEKMRRQSPFFSGGVDSSYVLAMSDVTRTDSCGYEEERFDESGLARQTADVLGRENTKMPDHTRGVFRYCTLCDVQYGTAFRDKLSAIGVCTCLSGNSETYKIVLFGRRCR